MLMDTHVAAAVLLQARCKKSAGGLGTLLLLCQIVSNDVLEEERTKSLVQSLVHGCAHLQHMYLIVRSGTSARPPQPLSSLVHANWMLMYGDLPPTPKVPVSCTVNKGTCVSCTSGTCLVHKGYLPLILGVPVFKQAVESSPSVPGWYHRHFPHLRLLEIRVLEQNLQRLTTNDRENNSPHWHGNASYGGPTAAVNVATNKKWAKRNNSLESRNTPT